MIYIPDGRNTTLQDEPHIEAAVTTPQGEECYMVYINYLQDTFDTNEFLLCKETFELFAVVEGLAMPTNLFTSDKPMDLDRLHQFLSETVQNNQQLNEPRRHPPMNFKERTALIESRPSTYCILVKTIQVFNNLISTDRTNVKQY